MNLSLDVYRGEALNGARRWADLHPQERRRRAVEAAQYLDGVTLWALTEAHTLLYGSAGAALSPRTARAYREGVVRFVEHAQRSGVSLIRPERDAGPLYARTLEAQGLAPSSVRVHLAAARALYKALRWAGVTELDPFSDTRPAKDKTAAWDKRQPYTEGEVRALLDASGPRDRALILLCAHGGLRISEALALTWADIQGDSLTVEHGKGGKLRRVVVSGTLSAALNTLGGAGGLPDGPVIGATQAAARQRLAALCRQAGVTYRGWHAFRHYAGTKLAATLGLEDAARHLGHASIETTRVYAKWADNTLRGELAGW
jgi:integrase/recombinase XerC